MRAEVSATYRGPMVPDFSAVGRALAAPARSTMIGMLMDGSSRPASELAATARIGASTASEHLSVLVESGLVTCTAHGRQRFYRLADAAVASALEQLAQLCPPAPISGLRQSREARRLMMARLCYDHLAGRLGVAMTDALVGRGWLAEESLTLTAGGATGLRGLGIDVNEISGRRPLTRACPDWTERRPHLAGALGATLAAHFVAQRWVRRRDGSRGIDLTPAGSRVLGEQWGIKIDVS